MLEPFHETLYTHYQLAEHKNLELLTRDAEGLQAAKRSAIAFHEPKHLEDERRELLDRMGALPDPAAALARGMKMIAALNTPAAPTEAASGSD